MESDNIQDDSVEVLEINDADEMEKLNKILETKRLSDDSDIELVYKVFSEMFSIQNVQDNPGLINSEEFEAFESFIYDNGNAYLEMSGYSYFYDAIIEQMSFLNKIAKLNVMADAKAFVDLTKIGNSFTDSEAILQAITLIEWYQNGDYGIFTQSYGNPDLVNRLDALNPFNFLEQLDPLELDMIKNVLSKENVDFNANLLAKLADLLTYTSEENVYKYLLSLTPEQRQIVFHYLDGKFQVKLGYSLD